MKNIIFALESHSSKYKQIYNQFKLLIENGDLPANEQLPSLRQLAESLKVSRNTTLMAYEQLAAEGYIRGAERKGYTVNELEPSLFQEGYISIPTNSSESQTESKTTFLIDFKAGAVNQKNFPLKAWRRISNSVLALQESFQYGDPFGEMCLREQIATYLFESRGVKTDPNAIIIGSSTQQMLINLGHILKNDFGSMILEDPGYDGAKAAFLFHSFSLETLLVDESGADFSHLENMVSRLIYVTPSHQSPMGVSMSIQQRQKLIQWANNREGYIIEDDYDSEFRYTQQPFPALASIDSKKVIYLGNFSKSFLPGIRISYMVLPQLLLSHYKEQFQHFESTTSLLSQLSMAKFMEEGEWNRHIKRMRLVYKRKMNCLVSELNKQFKNHISIIGEQSGLYLLVQIHQKHSESWLIERAAAEGIKVYPTSIYFIDNYPEMPMIKLGFSNLTCDEIQRGVKILKEAWL